MDYALWSNLRFTLVLYLVLSYDIMCQYHVYLRERVKRHKTQSLYFPDKTFPILYGIGLFHVHGHIPQCFPRFAPTFTRGAGMLDGELIETLWATLRGMIASTRSMATSHRKEVLDDHMYDVNWAKTTNIGE